MFDGPEDHEITIHGLEGYSIRGLSLDPDDSADTTEQNSPNEEEVALDEDSCSSTDSDLFNSHIFDEEDEGWRNWFTTIATHETIFGHK